MNSYKESFFDIADTNAKQTFTQDVDKVLNYFHLYWFITLIIKKTFPDARKFNVYLKTIGKVQIQNIDDSNELAAITRYAHDAGFLNSSITPLLTKFLQLLKTKPDLNIDEDLVRQWFTGTAIKLPLNPILKKARTDFVAGKTLLDIFPQVIKYFKTVKKDLKDSDFFPIINYFAVKINPDGLKAILSQAKDDDLEVVDTDDGKQVANNSTAQQIQDTLSNEISLLKLKSYLDEIENTGKYKTDKKYLNDRNYILATVIYSGSTAGLEALDSSLTLNNIKKITPYIEDEFEEFIKIPKYDSILSLRFKSRLFEFIVKLYLQNQNIKFIDNNIDIFSFLIISENKIPLFYDYLEYIFKEGKEGKGIKKIIIKKILSEKLGVLVCNRFINMTLSQLLNNDEKITDNNFISLKNSSIVVQELFPLITAKGYNYLLNNEVNQPNFAVVQLCLLCELFKNKEIKYSQLKNLIAWDKGSSDEQNLLKYLKWKYKELFDVSKKSDEELMEEIWKETQDWNEIYSRCQEIDKPYLFILMIIKYNHIYSYIDNFYRGANIPSITNVVDYKKYIKDKLKEELLKEGHVSFFEATYNHPDRNKYENLVIFCLDCFDSQKEKEKILDNIYETSSFTYAHFHVYHYLCYQFIGIPSQKSFQKFIEINKRKLKDKNLSKLPDSMYNYYVCDYNTEMMTLFCEYLIDNDYTSFTGITEDWTDKFKKIITNDNKKVNKLRKDVVSAIEKDREYLNNNPQLKWIFNFDWLKDNIEFLIKTFGFEIYSIFPKLSKSSVVIDYMLENKKYQDIVDSFEDLLKFTPLSTVIDSLLNNESFVKDYFILIINKIKSSEDTYTLVTSIMENITEDPKMRLLNLLISLLKQIPVLQKVINDIRKDTAHCRKFAESLLGFMEKVQTPELSNIMYLIQRVAPAVFKEMSNYMRNLYVSEKIFNDILYSDKNPLPLLKIDAVKKNLKNFLTVNDKTLNFDIDIPELKASQDFLEFITLASSAYKATLDKLQNAIPAPKVIPVEKTAEELHDTAFDINMKYNTQNHGNVCLKILKEWDYETPPEQQKAIDEFIKKHPNTDIAYPCFHSCGTLAGNMILRYWFSLSDEVKKVAKGLGKGIYFAPAIEKSLQYLGDHGMGRESGTKGYVLECELYLGVLGNSWDDGDYRDAIGTGWESAEYVIRDPWRQIKLKKIYYAEIAEMSYFKNAMKKKGIDPKIKTGQDRFITKREMNSEYGI